MAGGLEVLVQCLLDILPQSPAFGTDKLIHQMGKFMKVHIRILLKISW